MSSNAATKTDGRLAARFAALASIGASVIHFAVVPAHWQEWMPAGLFFVSVALFQLIWAPLVLARTTTPVLAAGIMMNVGAIALWAFSRTAGAPFGPHAGEAELVQAADLCALLLQIYVVMGAGWVLYRGLQGERVPAFANAMVYLGAVGVVVLASTVGVTTGLRHGHHAPATAETDHHGTSVEQADGQHHEHGSHQEHGQLREPIPPQPIIKSGGTPPAPIQAPPPPAQPLDDAPSDHAGDDLAGDDHGHDE